MMLGKARGDIPTTPFDEEWGKQVMPSSQLPRPILTPQCKDWEHPQSPEAMEKEIQQLRSENEAMRHAFNQMRAIVQEDALGAPAPSFDDMSIVSLDDACLVRDAVSLEGGSLPHTPVDQSEESDDTVPPYQETEDEEDENIDPSCPTSLMRKKRQMKDSKGENRKSDWLSSVSGRVRRNSDYTRVTMTEAGATDRDFGSRAFTVPSKSKHVPEDLEPDGRAMTWTTSDRDCKGTLSRRKDLKGIQQDVIDEARPAVVYFDEKGLRTPELNMCKEELEKMPACELDDSGHPKWDNVLLILNQYNLSDRQLELLVCDAADKMGFWKLQEDPSNAMMRNCRREIRRRLRLHDSQMRSTADAPSGSEGEGQTAGTGGSSPCVKALTPSPRSGEQSRRPRSKERIQRGGRLGSKESAGSNLSLPRQGRQSLMTMGTLAPSVCGSEGTIYTVQGTRLSTTSGYLTKAASIHFTDDATSKDIDSSRMIQKRNMLRKQNSFVGSRPKMKSLHEATFPQNPEEVLLRRYKVILWLVALVAMIIYAMYPFLYSTPAIYKAVGVGILIAKGSAMGTVFWTALLFFTMSRTLITWVTRLKCMRSCQFVIQFVNCFKELHLFSVGQICLCAVVHTVAHHAGTFVYLPNFSGRELNTVLNCAKGPEVLEKRAWTYLEVFRWPKCPLPDEMDVTYMDCLLTTPSITGYLLILLFLSLGWNSRKKKRTSNFRQFYAFHHILMPSWVVLLFLHGVNDWVGLGYPVVALVCGIPIALYAHARWRRTYYSYIAQVKIHHVQKSQTGKLLRLELKLPKHAYPECQVGHYAFLNIPEVAKYDDKANSGVHIYEWHPFTISNQRKVDSGDQIISFCIMMTGKWTKALGRTFQDCNQEMASAWKHVNVNVDGPYYAPAHSMPDRSTIVGVGSGVGCTPFLSFLGSIAENQGGGHKHAHIFWTSSNSSDFLLFGDLLDQVDRLNTKSNTKTNLHLHATPHFGPWRGKAGLGCLFDLAARDVWDHWKRRFAQKFGDETMVPTFDSYIEPLYGVITHSVLQSKRPLAVAVGMPDFEAELLAIGNKERSDDVFVYFCGNPKTQKALEVACNNCNTLRKEQGRIQRYYFYFERFG